MTRWLGIADAASLAGCKAATWRAYVTRGYAPDPGRRNPWTGQPEWDAATLAQWMSSRPGQGSHRHGGAPPPSRGPQDSRGFPAALWRDALAAGPTGDARAVTAVCPEHEPGGRVLATRAGRREARAACGAHYRASGHARPWVMDADRWETLIEMARDSGG